jgi:hypothetical protein
MSSATSALPRFLPPSPPSSLPFVRHCVASLLPPILLEPLPLFLLLIVFSRRCCLVIVVILLYFRRLSLLSRPHRVFFSSSHRSSSAAAAPLTLRPPNHWGGKTIKLLHHLTCLHRHLCRNAKISTKACIFGGTREQCASNVPSEWPIRPITLCPSQ